MKVSKSTVGAALFFLMGLGLLSFVLWKYPISEVFGVFRHITPLLLAGYLLASVSIMLIFATRWRMLLKSQGHDIPFFALFSYRIIDYGVGFVTPSGKLAGEPVRAAMLTRSGVSFKEGLTTTTIDKTIELSFTVIMFVIGCFLLILKNALSGELAVFLALLCAFLIFLNWTFYNRILRGKPVFIAVFRFFNLHKIKRLAKYQQVISEFEKPIIKFYNEEKAVYFKALGLSVLSFAMSMVEYSLLLMMVGVKPSLAQTFMVFSVVGMAFILPFPMGLGSLDVMQAWLFASLGLSSAAGVGLAMITRSRDILWVFAAVGFAMYYGTLKKVFSEAFNSKHANSVVKMTLFRGGKQDFLDMKLFRDRQLKKDDDYPQLETLRKKLFRKK
jgi:uncharacterized protein (TIRG00374 family)